MIEVVEEEEEGVGVRREVSWSGVEVRRGGGNIYCSSAEFCVCDRMCMDCADRTNHKFPVMGNTECRMVYY